jgi:hypothetical protein
MEAVCWGCRPQLGAWGRNGLAQREKGNKSWLWQEGGYNLADRVCWGNVMRGKPCLKRMALAVARCAR